MEVGFGGTSDRPLGFVAVTFRRNVPLLAVLLLASCKSAPQIAAVVAGGVTGAASGNAALGFAVGVATDAGANYLFRYVAKVRQGAEQDDQAHRADR